MLKMSKTYTFSYRCNQISIEEKAIESDLRQEKSTGDIRMRFDQNVNDDRRNGSAVFQMKINMLRGKNDVSGHDYALSVRLLVKFSYTVDIPTDDQPENGFWFPLVSDLYLIAQDRLKCLMNSMGIAGLSLIAPLPEEGFEVLAGQSSDNQKK